MWAAARGIVSQSRVLDQIPAKSRTFPDESLVFGS